MNRDNLPDDIRRFILTSIPSVPYLESVLLLRKESGSHWSASQLARRLYLPEAQTAGILESLEASGIVTKVPHAQPSYRYQPAAQLAQMLDGVAQHYAADLLAVTNLIHSGLNRRANQFADAFRWRKES
jgi:DNA-binding IclR family transcriptional regulator